MRRERILPALADINITNLVDVTLVLLIIFMITSPLLQGGVDVSLPKLAAARKDIYEGLVVTIAKDGRVYLGETPVALEGLREALTRARGRAPGGPVYLRADVAVPYGRVVEVIGQVKEAGIEDLGLVAEPDIERLRGR